MPPFDPRQILFLPAPYGYAVSILCGLLIIFAAYHIQRRSLFLYCLGGSIILTAPLFAYATDAIWGAYPTIDKEGSLLFYRDGVHLRMFQFSDPAHRLIGFHVGHLWISQIFDTVVSDWAAFNLQALLNIVLTWWLTTKLLIEMGSKRLWAWLLASQLALHLHIFRDIQFYTIEKSAIYPLPLFWYIYLRTTKGWKYGPISLGLVFLFSSWINLYWGIFQVVLTPLLLWIHRKENMKQQCNAILFCILCGLGIAFYQHSLTIGGPPFAAPEQFSMRAALDIFSIYPLSWNRLPWFSSISPLLCLGIGYGIKTKELHPRYIAIGVFFALLSLGPNITPQLPNPLYLMFQSLPALWRFAKPESLFFISYLVILSTLIHLQLSKRWLYSIALMLLLQWLYCVRSQPEYPPLTQHIESTLPKNWERRIFPTEKK